MSEYVLLVRWKTKFGVTRYSFWALKDKPMDWRREEVEAKGRELVAADNNINGAWAHSASDAADFLGAF